MYLNDLEKSLGEMQREGASTVHSTQQSTLLPAPTSHLPKRKRKAIFFLFLFCSPVTGVSKEPRGAPCSAGNQLHSAPKESSVNTMVVTHTGTHTHHCPTTHIQPSSQMSPVSLGCFQKAQKPGDTPGSWGAWRCL